MHPVEGYDDVFIDISSNTVVKHNVSPKEAEMQQHLATAWGIAPKVYEYSHNTLQMEYCGVSLNNFFCESPCLTEEVISVVLTNAIKAFLVFIALDLCHTDWHGGNILVNPQTLKVTLIDFEFCVWSTQDTWEEDQSADWELFERALRTALLDILYPDWWDAEYEEGFMELNCCIKQKIRDIYNSLI